MPGEAEVDQAMRKLQRYGEETTAAADYTRQLLDAIGGRIRAQQMHLEAYDHGVPDEREISGWKSTGATSGGQTNWLACGPKVGYWSKTQEHILITPEGVREVLRDNDLLKGLTADQRTERS